MSDEEIKIDLVINTANSASSVKDLKKSLKDLKDAAANVDESSEAFQRLAASAGEAKKRIEDINSSIKASTGDPIEKVAGSFGLMGNKIKELDFKAATTQLKNFAGNLKAMPFKEIATAAKGFGAEMMAMGAELMLNPIFLIVAVLAAIGVALWKVADDARETVNKQIEAYDELEKKIQSRYDREIKLAKAAKKDVDKIENEKLQVSLAINKRQIKMLEMLQSTWIGLDDEQKKKLDELREKSLNIYTDISAGHIAALTKRKEAAEAATKESLKSLEESKAKIAKIREEETKKHQAELDKQSAAWLKAKEDRIKLEKKLAEEALAEQIKNDEAELSATKNLIDKVTALKEAADLANAATEQEKVAIKQAHDLAEIEAEYQKTNLGVEAQQAKADAILQINLKAQGDLAAIAAKEQADYSAAYFKEIEDEKKKAKEILDIKKAAIDEESGYAKQGIQGVQDLSDLVFSIKNANLKKGSAEELAAAKKQFKVNKALQLTGAVIDAARAVMTSLASAPVAIGPIPNPAGIASLALVAVASAANIAKIASKQFDAGGGGGGGAAATVSAPSAGGGGGGFTPQSLQKIGGSNQLNNPMGLRSSVAGGAGQPQKIYVVSQDITNSQNGDQVLTRRANFAN